MTSGLPALGLPVEEGARLLALARVAAVDAASARLSGDADPEALHDFRVELRRLRSLLRAFRPWLRAGPRRRHLRALRRLAAGTGASRDAEVQLAVLAGERARIPPDRRAGLDWLVARLEAAAEAGAGDTARAVRRWRKLSRRLRRRLSTYERRLRPLELESFGGVLAALVEGQLEAFLAALAAVEGAGDVARAHRARLEAKRLRYLVEPLRDAPGLGARTAVERLQGVQDALGELHDAHVLEAAVEAARRGAARAGEGRAPALSPVTRVVRARRDRAYGALLRSGDALEALSGELKRLARAAASPGSTLWIARPADGIRGRDDQAP
ncbi:MAG: CHAD domain-containing protein [Anaeromyxobacteraceae bacterium]